MKPEVDEDRLDELLQMQFTCGDTTIFKGVERVKLEKPLSLEEVVLLSVLIYLLPDGPANDQSIEEVIESLDAVLENSIAVHQRSDVPYGLFCQGALTHQQFLH